MSVLKKETYLENELYVSVWFLRVFIHSLNQKEKYLLIQYLSSLKEASNNLMVCFWYLKVFLKIKSLNLVFLSFLVRLMSSFRLVLLSIFFFLVLSEKKSKIFFTTIWVYKEWLHIFTIVLNGLVLLWFIRVGKDCLVLLWVKKDVWDRMKMYENRINVSKII